MWVDKDQTEWEVEVKGARLKGMGKIVKSNKSNRAVMRVYDVEINDEDVSQ